jgi:ribosomal protein S26
LKPYTIPDSKFDYCFSCNYFEEVVAVHYLEQLNEEVPLCAKCAKEIGE